MDGEEETRKEECGDQEGGTEEKEEEEKDEPTDDTDKVFYAVCDWWFFGFLDG